MIQRTTSIILIILANILLFAASVIPHHHHFSVACLKNSHCVNEDAESNNVRTEHSHDGKSDYCVLRVADIRVSSQENFVFQCYNDADNNYTGYDYQACLSETFDKLIYQALKPGNPPWADYHNTSYFYFSAGLRAPPSV